MSEAPLKLIFPPRPKGKMLPADLPFYEQQGKWCAQRKFKGSRNLLHISPEGKLTVANRHGDFHARFELDRAYREEIMDALKIKKGVEYWLDSELMNKEVNARNEIILFDVLQAGRYFFGSPDQMARLEILREICGDPKDLEPGGLALQITPRLWMAETYTQGFVDRFNEALTNPRIEGLVLRKKAASLDNWGHKEYETPNLIRCRKPFAPDKGYNF